MSKFDSSNPFGTPRPIGPINKIGPNLPKRNSFEAKSTPDKPVHPTLDSHQEKSFSKPEDSTRKQDESLFGGREVAGYEVKRFLEKNPEGRKELAKRLKLKPYSPEMDAEIKKMEEMILNPKYGGFISPSEANRALNIEGPWHEKHQMAEDMKGGIFAQEIKGRIRREKTLDFLKEKFGFGKK